MNPMVMNPMAESMKNHLKHTQTCIFKASNSRYSNQTESSKLPTESMFIKCGYPQPGYHKEVYHGTIRKKKKTHVP